MERSCHSGVEAEMRVERGLDIWALLVASGSATVFAVSKHTHHVTSSLRTPHKPYRDLQTPVPLCRPKYEHLCLMDDVRCRTRHPQIFTFPYFRGYAGRLIEVIFR